MFVEDIDFLRIETLHRGWSLKSVYGFFSFIDSAIDGCISVASNSTLNFFFSSSTRCLTRPAFSHATELPVSQQHTFYKKLLVSTNTMKSVENAFCYESSASGFHPRPMLRSHSATLSFPSAYSSKMFRSFSGSRILKKLSLCTPVI